MKPKFRKLTEADKPLIASWIAADPDHTAIGMTAEFFYREFFSFAVEDEEGAVLFIALEPTPPDMIVHIQFGVSKSRTAKALVAGFTEVKEQCKRCGAKALIFETVSPSLARFCSREFGYHQIEGTNNWRLEIG